MTELPAADRFAEGRKANCIGGYIMKDGEMASMVSGKIARGEMKPGA